MKDSEKWRVIPGYENYEASSFGAIRRLTRSGNAMPGKVLKPKKTVHGYLTVTVVGSEGRKCHNVHRLIAMAFLGTPPQGMQACHINGNRLDNRAENLRWDTAKNNTLDKYGHGTMHKAPRGEKHWAKKLDEQTVREMREMRHAGKTVTSIAAHFGIAKLTAYDAITGKTWGHVA